MSFARRIEEDGLIDPGMVKVLKRWSAPKEDDEQFDRHMENYNRTLRMRFLFIAACAVVIVISAGVAVSYGAMDISFQETYRILWNHLTGNIEDKGLDFIIVNVRAPRIFGALIGGAGLALCGVIMQSALRNPLADPYTTGVSAGASFGATIAITGGMAVGSNMPIVILAFIFSLIPTVAIIMMSRTRTASNPTTMIMFGIGLMYLFNAMTTTLMLWATPEDLAAVYQWQVGSVAKVKWEDIPIMAAVVFPGYIALQLLAGKLNILATGDDSAKALGVNAQRLRVVLLAITSLICAAVVSFTGVIGFVGLVAPHIVRIFIGADNRYLLPASALFGSMLLILADFVGRFALSPTVLPCGVVMSFIGGPAFVWLLMRRGNRAW